MINYLETYDYITGWLLILGVVSLLSIFTVLVLLWLCSFDSNKTKDSKNLGSFPQVEIISEGPGERSLIQILNNPPRLSLTDEINEKLDMLNQKEN